MTAIYDCSVDSQLLTGMRLARGAIGRGELVVIPTDTVYGVAADAFDAAAVSRLLEAKGRERSSPPPVLIPGIPTLDALASEVPGAVRRLVEEFWPGGLTVILHAQPSLQWDLGETRGTVALRMPANPIALELLSETGPLAVSSANLSGQPSAVTAADAEAMLGDSVTVYLDGGPAGEGYEAIGERPGDTSSTIVDATGLAVDGGVMRIVRAGVISRERIAEVVGEDMLAPADEAATIDPGAEAATIDPVAGAASDEAADGAPAGSDATAADGAPAGSDATAADGAPAGSDAAASGEPAASGDSAASDRDTADDGADAAAS